MSAEKTSVASNRSAPKNTSTRLTENPVVIEFITILAVTLLILMVMMIVNRTERSLVIFTALLGGVVWALLYQVILWKGRGDSAGQITAGSYSPAAVTRMETRLQSGNLTRYGVGFVGVALILLAGALLLDQFGFLDEAIIGIPLVAVFPFSYLAYVAFQRNVRIERLRRDFQLLDAKWDRTLFEHSQGMINFVLHIVLAMLVTIGGLAIFRYAAVDSINPLLTERTLWAMRYGFIGAYLFSIQIIYRRYTTYDLLPSVYLYCALTIIGGLIFNYALVVAIAGTPTSDPKEFTESLPWTLAVIAFALGFFPLLAVQWLSRTIQNLMAVRERRSEDMPLGMIDGISQFHETRLRDIGIDNVENLATTDIPFVLINTTFSVQEIIDWVDQAILYIHLQMNGIASFRSGTVRTVSDFRQVWRRLYKPTKRDAHRGAALTIAQNGAAVSANSESEEDNERKNKALLLQSTPEQLDLLYESTEPDPNVHYIMHYWEHVDTLLPNLYGARVNYLLEQAFWTRPSDPMNVQGTQEVKAQLDNYWDEWITYRDEIGDDDGCQNTLIPSNGLAYAGLGYLYQYQHSLGNTTSQTGQADCYLDHVVRYYVLGYRHNSEVNERIKNRLKELPVAACPSLDTVANEFPDMRPLIREVRDSLACIQVSAGEAVKQPAGQVE